LVLILISKNQPNWYDLNQYQSQANNCLVGTGGTNLIPKLHQSRYEAYSCCRQKKLALGHLSISLL
jgi:hypothetical protein